MSAQVTTLTLCRYKGLWNKAWAFTMVQFGNRYLKNISGLQFYKLLGSGRGMGFNPRPDWSVYMLLQVWESEQQALDFFRSSSLIRRYDKHACERGVLFLKNKMARGLWSKSEPFQPSSRLSDDNEHVAIITRAKIRNSKLVRFWKHVPTARKPIAKAKGLLYTKGIGEIPIKQMATISIWESQQAMRDFAYNSPEHLSAIKMTRELNWYSEELFARFQPYRFEGSWEGQKWRFE